MIQFHKTTVEQTIVLNGSSYRIKKRCVNPINHSFLNFCLGKIGAYSDNGFLGQHTICVSLQFLQVVVICLQPERGNKEARILNVGGETEGGRKMYVRRLLATHYDWEV